MTLLCMEIYNDNINIMYRNELEIQRLKEESKEKHHKTVHYILRKGEKMEN